MNKTYRQKLQDPRWQKRRLQILEKHGFRCQLCNAGEKMLTVHHVNYTRGKEPWEYPDKDLMCLCAECHTQVEQVIIPELRRLAVTVSPVVSFDVAQCLLTVASDQPKASAKALLGEALQIATEQTP